jgi:ABC-2 type transport system permease protein
MPLAMLGGGMVPLIAMPEWMQAASNVSPIKWGIEALEGAIWRDYSLTDMLLRCGVLVGVGAVCFALGVMNLKRREG